MRHVAASTYETLPPNLPAPDDDGACDHLPGSRLPSLLLPAHNGSRVDLALLSQLNRVVIFCYPRTGRPGVALREGWDAIPGARGCTPQSCAFRDEHAAFASLGTAVFGLSTQDGEYQSEVAARLRLPYLLLSDAEGRLRQALGLPSFEVEGEVLLKRATLILRQGVVEKVFYPVFPPDRSAAQVLEWLRSAQA